MQFSVSVSALALVASAIAQAVDFNAINTPQSGEVVPAGSVFPIKWKVSEKYQSGTVSIDLLAGDSPETLTPAMNLANGVDNSAKEFNWSVDPSLGKAKTYGVKFTLESDQSVYQYSMPFQISSGAKACKPEHKGTEEKIATPSIVQKFEHAPLASPPSDTFRKLNLTGDGLSANRTLFRVPISMPPNGYGSPESAPDSGKTTATAPSTGAGQHVLSNLVAIGATVAFLLL